MPLDERVQAWLDFPWLIYRKPFKVVDHVYFVGNRWVSCYLVETKKGLVLIDAAMQETFYLVVDNIRAMGFDPHKIKYLLLTHGHFDHTGAARAVQEMCGCETWIGKDDAFFFTERRDLINFEWCVPEFKIDHFYDYDSELDFGDIKIKPVHCPGHTPGTTSLFFDVQHQGKTLTCGIHGGLGAYVLSRRELSKVNLPFSIQQTYLDSLNMIKDRKVDVIIPSHAAQTVGYKFFDVADADDGTGSGFIDPAAWNRMVTAKIEEMERMMQKEKEEAGEV